MHIVGITFLLFSATAYSDNSVSVQNFPALEPLEGAVHKSLEKIMSKKPETCIITLGELRKCDDFEENELKALLHFRLCGMSNETTSNIDTDDVHLLQTLTSIDSCLTSASNCTAKFDCLSTLESWVQKSTEILVEVNTFMSNSSIRSDVIPLRDQHSGDASIKVFKLFQKYAKDLIMIGSRFMKNTFEKYVGPSVILSFLVFDLIQELKTPPADLSLSFYPFTQIANDYKGCGIFKYQSKTCKAIGSAAAASCSHGGLPIYSDSCKTPSSLGGSKCRLPGINSSGCSAVCVLVNTEECTDEYEHFRNRDYKGKVFGQLLVTDLRTCKQHCAKSDQCLGFSLHYSDPFKKIPDHKDLGLVCTFFSSENGYSGKLDYDYYGTVIVKRIMLSR